jgi:hypothetical protein
VLKKPVKAFSATPPGKCDSRVAHIFDGFQSSKMAAHPEPRHRLLKNKVFQQSANDGQHFVTLFPDVFHQENRGKKHLVIPTIFRASWLFGRYYRSCNKSRLPGIGGSNLKEVPQ